MTRYRGDDPAGHDVPDADAVPADHADHDLEPVGLGGLPLPGFDDPHEPEHPHGPDHPHDPYGPDGAGSGPGVGGTGHDGPVGRRAARAGARERARHARRRRLTVVLTLVAVLVVGTVVWVASGRLFGPPTTSDYAGQGTGTARVTVRAGDGAAQIGDALVARGVVKTTGAFVAAARADTRAQSIQPGVYQLRTRMSGRAALTLLLDPASKLDQQVTVTDGQITPQVVQAVATALKLPVDQVTAAAADVAALGLPTSYGAPTAVEGFLYPETYSFDPGTSAVTALRQMVTQYTTVDRTVGLSDAAGASGLTPYQVLVVASIAQSEAKFPADFGKVARVILNRIAAGRPLQIDATSAYAAKLQGLDPTKVVYDQVPGPYNSYVNPGLPPTPIGNPGRAALQGAAHPDAGDWMYYVNGDAQGHLFFTNDENAFAAAAAACKANGWGCG